MFQGALIGVTEPGCPVRNTAGSIGSNHPTQGTAETPVKVMGPGKSMFKKE